MKRIIPARFRYPLFFIGIMMIASAGFIYRYLHPPVQAIEAIVVVGFALFVASVAL